MRHHMHHMHHEHGHGPRHGNGFWAGWGMQWGPGGMHGRGRWGGPGRGGDWENFFSGGGDRPWGRHFGGPGGPGRGRERLERGLLRHVILSVLQNGPMHGYEIIKQIEDKTHGWYSPSPGTLYPTLQYLEDLGLVKAEQEADKRVYHLTDEGRAELDKQHAAVEGFWGRFREQTAPGANLHEMRFVGDAIRDLMRTVGGAIKGSAMAGDTETVRKIRQALERCQSEIREILAQSGQASASTAGAEPGSPGTPNAEDTYSF